MFSGHNRTAMMIELVSAMLSKKERLKQPTSDADPTAAVLAAVASDLAEALASMLYHQLFAVRGQLLADPSEQAHGRGVRVRSVAKLGLTLPDCYQRLSEINQAAARFQLLDPKKRPAAYDSLSLLSSGNGGSGGSVGGDYDYGYGYGGGSGGSAASSAGGVGRRRRRERAAGRGGEDAPQVPDVGASAGAHDPAPRERLAGAGGRGQPRQPLAEPAAKR